MMANMDAQPDPNIKSFSGITLTLPREYRPQYRTIDPLLQSSSEQSTLSLNCAVEESIPTYPTVSPRQTPSDQWTVPGAGSTAPQTMQTDLTRTDRWQPNTLSWTYCPSYSSVPSERFDAFPYQRGWRGGTRRGCYRGRNDFYVGRAPWGGRHRGPNDLYVGRVSLPLVDFKTVLPCNVDVGKYHWLATPPKSAMDFFLPKIVRDPITNTFAVDQRSEICSTWRGLSSAGAEELFFWANIYQVVLSQRKDIGLTSTKLSSIAAEVVRRYEQGPRTGYYWFFSAPDIYQMVERFLSISTETPGLRIEQLEVPVAGQEYTLAPEVLNKLDGLSDDFAREIIFSTSADWLLFDSDGSVFRGTVPSVPPSRIMVKAKVTEYLDERVRIEHVIRVNLDFRARSASSAGQYLTEIFAVPKIDDKPVNTIPMPKKQVSFADDHEIDSLPSSPDHLRSFFNELAALTRDPALETSSPTLALTDPSSLAGSAVGYESIPDSDALHEAKEGVEVLQKNIVTDASTTLSASVADNSNRRRRTSADSPGQLYPQFQHHRPERSGYIYEENASRPGSGADSGAIPSASAKVRHSCAHESSCVAPYKANRTWSTSSSFSFDSDTSLDLDIALGISDKIDCLPEPDRSTPLPCQNHFHILSECSNMNRQTQMCESMICSEAESQHDDYRFPEYTVFGSKSSAIVNKKDGSSVSFKALRNDLHKWNWKGWEKEIGAYKRRSNMGSNSALSGESSKMAMPSIPDEAGLDDSSATREVPGNSREDVLENERAVLKHPRHDSSTLSSATTKRSNRYSSEASWSLENELSVLSKTTNGANKSTTLYDTVRNQFYKDHQVRQMPSPRHSQPSSRRTVLRGIFSSQSEPAELTTNGPDHGEDDLAVVRSRTNDTEPISGFQIHDRPLSPASLESEDESGPDMESIAEAVKNSLEAEVQCQDGREHTEIRKGILHHQVMELRKNRRRRDFGSSTYDDIFWSSDETSVDDRMDSATD